MMTESRPQQLQLPQKDFLSYLELFEEHQDSLLIYSFMILRDVPKARAAVRQAFNNLWNNPEKWNEQLSVYKNIFFEVKQEVYFLKTAK
jgi:hypothetical protein